MDEVLKHLCLLVLQHVVAEVELNYVSKDGVQVSVKTQ
jgi:hypothetical protein